MDSGVKVAGELIRVEIDGAVAVTNVIKGISLPLSHHLHLILLVIQHLGVYLYLFV